MFLYAKVNNGEPMATTRAFCRQMASGGTILALQQADLRSRSESPGQQSGDSMAVNVLRTSRCSTADCFADGRRRYADDDVEARAPLGRSHNSSLKNDVPDTILRLNIGGASYRIRTRSIAKFGPMTLLGRFVRMNHEHRRQWADWYFEETEEYFFERVPRYFDPIYDFYATGKVHVPKDLCFDKFMAELRYWAVSKSKMDDCCSPFAQFNTSQRTTPEQAEKDQFIGLRCAHLRRRLWLVLEGHSKSMWWKAFEITSTSFVFLSILALILGSIPEFQVPERENARYSAPLATLPPNLTDSSLSSAVGEETEDMVEHPVFNYIENVCVIYFTIEYVVRLWVAPKKIPFIKDFLNVVDLLAIMPFIFEILLLVGGISGDKVRKVRWAFLTMRLLRVLRVVRIAKLGRFSPGLANFALTLRRSKKQMQMVGIVMITVVIFFSTLVYFLEKDAPDSRFTSIPAASWWCIVTMTTVGYGDVVPVTV
uniref:Uncharacterized protein n=1 Tax=Plectus sambesii TaxID=2011161 RepID=A0A914VYK1_9BILA